MCTSSTVSFACILLACLGPAMWGADRTARRDEGKAPEGGKRLNNLVWELVNTKPGTVEGERSFPFTTSRTRWLYVRVAGHADGSRMKISLQREGEEPEIIMVFHPGEKKTREVMRFLPAGNHRLVVRSNVLLWEGRSRVDSLIVRSIPELVYAQFTSTPWIQEFGPFGEDFLERYVIPNVNTFVCVPDNFEDPLFKRLQPTGRRWLAKYRTPDEDTKEKLAPEQLAKHIAKTVGFANPAYDGVVADEFKSSEPRCANYAEALRRLHAELRFKDKLFYPYALHLYDGEPGREFVNAVIETGAAIAWKRYLKSQPDEGRARDYLQRELVEHARRYRELSPGSIEHIVVCFGYFAIPPEFLNHYPSVNYKKYLDMQFNIVANDPAFRGTYGLMTYLANYADEETARWAAHLFRHYGIEGRTEPATDDPYESDHIRNGDFTYGTDGWTIEPAEKDSIRPVRKDGFGYLQGRWPRTSEGDSALLTVRTAKGPNVFSQDIVNLEPGRLYSFRMITGDYEDLSRKRRHAVTVRIEGASEISEKCFVSVFANRHRYGPYDRRDKAWMNYHWQVFRAEGTKARLIVSDWADQDKPGGPIGQELIYNYVSVQPYYAGD